MARNSIFKTSASRFVAVLLTVTGLLGFILQGLDGFVVAVVLALFILCTHLVIEYNRTGQWESKRNSLFEGLANPDFLSWQQQTLEVLYPDVEIVSLLDQRFPAAVLRHQASLAYPFPHLCKLLSYRIPAESFDSKQAQYIQMLGSTLRTPKMKGFALSKILFDNKRRTKTFETVAIRQIHSLATCHILEWEMLSMFMRRRGKRVSSLVHGLRDLPYRSKYHEQRKGSIAITEPRSAYPLLSVQGMVVFYDNRRSDEKGWRVVLARRSDNVLVKPGFLQFQPAGGFEVYGSEHDESDFLLKQGFDVGDALLREYAEELFDAEELQENPDGRDPQSIRSHSMIAPLLEAIERGTARIEFLGTIVDLTILRHELSFLILIHDEFFCKSKLDGSWESKNIIAPFVHDLPEALREGQMHGSSAGLLKLVLESEIGKDVFRGVNFEASGGLLNGS